MKYLRQIKNLCVDLFKALTSKQAWKFNVKLLLAVAIGSFVLQWATTTLIYTASEMVSNRVNHLANRYATIYPDFK